MRRRGERRRPQKLWHGAAALPSAVGDANRWRISSACHSNQWRSTIACCRAACCHGACSARRQSPVARLPGVWVAAGVGAIAIMDHSMNVLVMTSTSRAFVGCGETGTTRSVEGSVWKACKNDALDSKSWLCVLLFRGASHRPPRRNRHISPPRGLHRQRRGAI